MVLAEKKIAGHLSVLAELQNFAQSHRRDNNDSQCSEIDISLSDDPGYLEWRESGQKRDGEKSEPEKNIFVFAPTPEKRSQESQENKKKSDILALGK